MAKVTTRRTEGYKPVMSDEQVKQIEEVCELLDKIFPHEGKLAPVLLITNGYEDVDVVSRLGCSHCLWKLFQAQSQKYLFECFKEGLIDTVEAGTAPHKVH